MRRQLGTQDGVLVGGDERGVARDGFAVQAAGVAPQLGIPLDGGAAHPKEARHLTLAAATIDSLHDLHSEVGRICVHTLVCQLAQPSRQAL
jgi:hypothetical protein